VKFLRNALKVAKWEFKRNIKNKSFLIGLFITPAIFLVFMLLGSYFGDSDDGENQATRVFINDQLGLFDTLQETVEQHQLNWELHLTDISEDEVKTELESSEHTVYLFLDQRVFEENLIPVYTSEKISPFFMNQIQVFEAPLKAWQMKQLGLSDDQLALISAGIRFEETTAQELAQGKGEEAASPVENILERAVPGLFAGIILLSIIFSGMYIFQSASQEKKDKVAEIILSSITPGDLMQGKIIGYFLLGMVQAAVFLIFAVGVALWKLDVPIIQYLFIPELILFILIAIMGYLLFAALFMGVGATMADVTTSGNFQGLVFMLPFLPFIFMGPIINNPSGLIAQIGTYIPFSAPGVLLLRLSLLEEWPWVEIIIALVILIVSIIIMMKLAGKIFKTGILMYGKNATLQEIWKWIRA
jgi:ABC-2 type transport system permease protein